MSRLSAASILHPQNAYYRKETAGGVAGRVLALLLENYANPTDISATHQNHHNRANAIVRLRNEFGYEITAERRHHLPALYTLRIPK